MKMKMKSYIFHLALAGLGLGVFSSCEDMLEPDSKHVLYHNGDSHITSAADSATSFVGILYQLSAIADRSYLLGEVRGDLVKLRNNAKADLHELANFNISDDNMYNNPRDYYAIINNCNYFVAYADTNAVNNAGDKLFEKEMAQVKAVRAWTYLELLKNYGRIPFYLNPLLTEQDAEKIGTDAGSRKGIVEVCQALIEDLTPYIYTETPQFHSVYVVNFGNAYFPVDMVLGDLYLWKASQTQSETDYRNAAKCYFRWINDQRRMNNWNKSKFIVSTDYRASWGEATFNGTDKILVPASSLSSLYSFAMDRTSTSEIFTAIAMDTIATQGFYTQLPQLYNTTNESGTYVEHSIEPSDEFRAFSRSQEFYYIDGQTHEHVEIVVDEEYEDYVGDLRLPNLCKKMDVSGMIETDIDGIQTMSKIGTSSTYVPVYRQTDVWLRLAEALNNGGFPRFAHAILATGLSEDLYEEELKKCDNMVDRAFLTELNGATNYFRYFEPRKGTNNSSADDVNCMGIHSRGCGYAEMNPNYAYPIADTTVAAFRELQAAVGVELREKFSGEEYDFTQVQIDSALVADSALTCIGRWEAMGNHKQLAQNSVDSMLIDEMALETCFEGRRLYDVIRFGSRRGTAWLRGHVFKDALLDQNNWFMSWKGQIGMK